MEQINYTVNSLDDFLLNSRAKTVIRNIALKGNFPNAFLLEGRKGSGRKTLALIIAALSLCENSYPCSGCNSCRKVFNSIHPDVYFFKPKTSNDYSVSVIREISKTAYIKPNEGKRNVFILPDAELMSEKSQNALLKIIEEPPNGCLFIFTSQNRRSVLPTILSRTSVLTLDTPSEEQKRDFLFSLREKKIIEEGTSDEDISAAAKLSEGGFGDAIFLLGENERKEIFKKSLLLASLISQKDEYGALKLCDEITRAKIPADEVLKTVKGIFEQEAKNAVTKKPQTKTIKALEPKEYLKISEKAEEGAFLINSNLSPGIVFSAFISSLF